MPEKVARSIEVGTACVAQISGVEQSQIYYDRTMFKDVYLKGEAFFKDTFGEDSKYFKLRAIHCPPCSYGHMASLGATVTFPHGGDYSVKPFISDIYEGIELLKRDIDFADNDLFRYFADYNNYLKTEFPDRKVAFGGYGGQGPITSAVLMRGQDFYLDLYDDPEGCHEFLSLLTDSIIKFRVFTSELTSTPAFNKAGASLADDFAALIPPKLFDEFVTPYWNRCYSALTTGKRFLHCEGFYRQHLPYLAHSGITHFQPSVSPNLTCRMLAEDLSIDYDWMLPSYQIIMMTPEEITEWINETTGLGCVNIRTQTSPLAFTQDRIKLYKHFLKEMHRFD